MSNSPICEIVFYPVFMLSEPQHVHWPEDFVGQFQGVGRLDAESLLLDFY
jgi:hypothetical protein